jgi:hypothetical protein
MDPRNANKSFLDSLEINMNITVDDDGLAVDLDTKQPLTKDEINARCSALDDDILSAGFKIIDVN